MINLFMKFFFPDNQSMAMYKISHNILTDQKCPRIFWPLIREQQMEMCKIKFLWARVVECCVYMNIFWIVK